MSPLPKVEIQAKGSKTVSYAAVKVPYNVSGSLLRTQPPRGVEGCM